jgi:CubicO group peptidase (beta-lactamase class C family)
MTQRRSPYELRVSVTLLTLCGLLIGVASATGTPSSGEESSTELGEAVAEALLGWLPDRLEDSGVPGAAVTVVGRQEIIREEVFGVAGAPGSSPITPDTIFLIRSISKSVTAIAVLMAVQDGLVDLDAPISEYLPEFTIPSRFEEHPEDVMTLRHMLSHWAGFTHDPPAGLDLDKPGYFERYIERVGETWLRVPVAYRLHYSTYGLDLAGYILQIRSGLPFARYLQEKVLGPIGMTRSSFDLVSVELEGNRAIGHDGQGDVTPVPFPEIAAAGLYSSIRDMSRYAQFHLNGGDVNGRRLLREDLMEQAHSIQFARPDQRTGYSFGLWREPVGGTFSLYHEGGGRGFNSHMILYPELGLGVITLTNKEYQGLTGYVGRIVMSGPIVNRYGPVPVADPGIESMERLDVRDPRLKPILGRYGDSPGVVVGFENGVLGLRSSETSFLPLTFYDDGGELVGMYGSTNEVRFLPPLPNQPGSMMMVSRTVSNSNSHYLDFNDSSLDPPGPANPEWSSYVGEYYVLWEDEPGSSATVAIRNGYLYFRDGKCEEHEPGLFFLYDGETLDFRSSPSTFANQAITKK